MVDSLPVSSQQSLPQSAGPEQSQVTPPPSQQTVLATASALTMEYAGLGARFLASLVDGMIVGAIYFILMIPVLIIGVMTAAASGRQDSALMVSALGFVFQLIGWVASIGYYLYFTAKGQTLGKKVLKIRVVRVENGETPGYTKAFLREVVGKLVSAMVFGLGYLWMLWDGKKQTWHDKIAGTVVVKV